MADKEKINALLNSYRDEIMAKSPKSLATWQKNRQVMPAGVGSVFRLAVPFPMVVQRAQGARIWDVSPPAPLAFCAASRINRFIHSIPDNRGRPAGTDESTVGMNRTEACESRRSMLSPFHPLVV